MAIKFRALPLLVTIVFFPFLGWPQSKEVDSLQHLVRTLPNDTTRVYILNKLVSALRESDIHRALEYGIEAKQLAELIDFKRGKAVALENLGWVYYRRGDYTKAFKLSSEALKIFEHEGDEIGAGRAMINIAGLRFEQKQFDVAIAYFKTVLTLAQTRSDDELIARCLNNIAFSFYSNKNLDSAQHYALRGLKSSEKSKSLYMIGAALRTLGDIEHQKGNYPEAVNLFDQSLELSRKIDNRFLEASILPRMAGAYEKMNKVDEAISLLHQNVKLASDYGYKDKLEWTYKFLADLNAKKKNMDQAFYFQSRYLAIHDSLAEQRSNEQLALMQLNFDTEMKEAKIELLTRDARLREDEIVHQRLWIYFAASCVVLLIVLALVLLNSNKVRKKVNESLAVKNMEMETQAQELSNLNITKDKLFSIISHDLRSPLASFRGLIDLVHTNELSREDFIEVSKKLKSSLESLNDDLDNLLLWAQSQLRGLQVKPESIHLKPVVEEKINLFKEVARTKNISLVNLVKDDLMVCADKNHVSIVIRNLLANAIKFNRPGGSVVVHQRDHNGVVEISVEDSGVGMASLDLNRLFNVETHFSNPGTGHEKGSGIGLLLTKEFIEKNGGAIWASSELGKGSTFTFTLKREHQANSNKKIPDFKLAKANLKSEI